MRRDKKIQILFRFSVLPATNVFRVRAFRQLVNDNKIPGELRFGRLAVNYNLKDPRRWIADFGYTNLQVTNYGGLFMSNFCILLTGKMKTNQKIINSCGHNNRKIPAPHTDTAREYLNLYMDKDVNIVEKLKARFAEAKVKPAKNSVLLVEVFLGASSEGMNKIIESGRFSDWFSKSVKFIQKEFGEENLIDITLHRDELEDHIHILAAPIVFRNEGRFAGQNRLSATEVIGNKLKLIKLQDRYADEMAEFGLERGVKGSVATHQDTARWRGIGISYDKVQQEAEQVKLLKSDVEKREQDLEASKQVEQKNMEIFMTDQDEWGGRLARRGMS